MPTSMLSRSLAPLFARAAVTEHDLVPGRDRGAPGPAARGLAGRALARRGRGRGAFFLLRGLAGAARRGHPGPLGRTAALVSLGGWAEPAADWRDRGAGRGPRARRWRRQFGVGKAQAHRGVVGRRDVPAVRVEDPFRQVETAARTEREADLPSAVGALD